MDFSVLADAWCILSPEAKVIIVTDSDRYSLAQELQTDMQQECHIINIEESTDYIAEIKRLSPSDLAIALFSFDTFIQKGANKVFSPFAKPADIRAKYVFIRLGITRESLLQGLSTPIQLVHNTIDRLHNFKDESKLRVLNAARTDITLSIKPFVTCDHHITRDGGMAFLPPSETSSEVIPNTANGKIVVDVTVGQLYYNGNLLGEFGLVNEPVTIHITNGLVTDITGGIMAAQFKEKLFALPEPCRILVELGHGLSKMIPTGLIGVDESIIDTCHFGIGDGGTCGVHLDVVISKPTIQEVQ